MTISDGYAVDTLMLRSARLAKLGARAASLSKECEGLGVQVRSRTTAITPLTTDAKVLRAHLSQALSTKVAMITVVLVLGIPLLLVSRGAEPLRGYSS